MSNSGSILILLASAGVLVYVAFTDLRQFKIRNDLVILLVVLASLYYFVDGQWRALIWNIGFALVVLVPMLYFYSMRMMGGGDLKLIFAALIWVGPFLSIEFALLLAVFSMGHSLAARMGWAGAQTLRGRMAIPLAPSIAAALIVVFLSGGLDAQVRAAFYDSISTWISHLIYQVAPWIPHT